MFLYFILFRIAAWFNPKARMIVRGQSATIKRLKKETFQDRYVWFHAASVGEFEQARPIIERLKRLHPEKKVLLTFFSCSGYELRKDYEYADLVLYLPFATRRNAKLFLQKLPIEMAIFIKYEYWPAYLKALKKRDIPTFLISAVFRKHQAFFRWYGAPYRYLLKLFSLLFVQDERSRELLARYGIDKVVVAGDTRFDRVVAVADEPFSCLQMQCFVEPEISPLSNIYSDKRKVVIAGSTWPEDEALLARYMEEHPEIKLVLVPHELTPEHLHDIFNRFKGRFVRFSEATMHNLSTASMLVVDKMGLLSHLYRYGQVAYIGGGFGDGIHNTIEAAVYGLPVVFGPKYHKFREAEELVDTGAGLPVKDYKTFAKAMDQALAEYPTLGPIARDYVREAKGATARIYGALFE